MSPIRARSRRPTTVDVSMLSSSARPFGRIEHRRLPGRHDVPGPAYRPGRVDRHDLAGDQPVEQVTDRSEPLLDARRSELARAGLHPGRYVDRLDGADRRHAGGRAPGQELIGGAGIGAACAGCGCWLRGIRGTASRRARRRQSRVARRAARPSAMISPRRTATRSDAAGMALFKSSRLWGR